MFTGFSLNAYLILLVASGNLFLGKFLLSPQGFDVWLLVLAAEMLQLEWFLQSERFSLGCSFHHIYASVLLAASMVSLSLCLCVCILNISLITDSKVTDWFAWCQNNVLGSCNTIFEIASQWIVRLWMWKGQIYVWSTGKYKSRYISHTLPKKHLSNNCWLEQTTCTMGLCCVICSTGSHQWSL